MKKMSHSVDNLFFVVFRLILILLRSESVIKRHLGLEKGVSGEDLFRTNKV